MNKTIEQLYEEIKSSEVLSAELNDIVEDRNKEKLTDWISQQGCEASMEEIKAFLIEKGEEIQDSGELTPEELEQIAGGSITTPGCLAGIIATFTLGIGGAVVTGLAGCGREEESGNESEGGGC